MNISFIGDLIFGDTPVTFSIGVDGRHHGGKYSTLFCEITKPFKQSANVIANFECVIKARKSRSIDVPYFLNPNEDDWRKFLMKAKMPLNL